jgi:mono/diheme cytochrome c family protein
VRHARALLALALAALIAACSSHAQSPGAAPVYRSVQAEAGEQAYLANCSMCHGVRLEGGPGPALRGVRMRALAKAQHLRVGDVFWTVAKQMPLNTPGSLSDQQDVEIMAYILESNGYAAGSSNLTYDAAVRSQVPFQPAGGP